MLPTYGNNTDTNPITTDLRVAMQRATKDLAKQSRTLTGQIVLESLINDLLEIRRRYQNVERVM